MDGIRDSIERQFRPFRNVNSKRFILVGDAILTFDSITLSPGGEFSFDCLCFSFSLQILLFLSLQLLIDFGSSAGFIPMTSCDGSWSHGFVFLLLILLRGSGEGIRD